MNNNILLFNNSSNLSVYDLIFCRVELDDPSVDQVDVMVEKEVAGFWIKIPEIDFFYFCFHIKKPFYKNISFLNSNMYETPSWMLSGSYRFTFTTAPSSIPLKVKSFTLPDFPNGSILNPPDVGNIRFDFNPTPITNVLHNEIVIAPQ